MANTISSDLQLTKVLDNSLRAFKRTIIALTVFSTVFKRTQLMGEDSITVPYYPLATSASASREPDGSYMALATSTATESRKIYPTKNKVQAISFTSTERNRQPAFDPVMHGTLKGEKLAFDVIGDILSGVRSSTYPGTTISPVISSNFDENDVADLGKLCMDDFWSESGRGLLLGSGHYYNLIKQPQIIDVSKSGSDQALREAIVRRLLGFDVMGSAGVPTNNGTAFAITGTAATDIISAVAHPLANGDRVRFPALTGGDGLTADTGRYFVIDAGADTFKVSATPGGAAVDFSTNVTAGTCQRYENLAGFACFPSAILTGFAPVQPSEKMLQGNLVDYRVVEDDDSDIVLEYKHLVYGDTDQEVQVIECHYGYEYGEAAALKPILIS